MHTNDEDLIGMVSNARDLSRPGRIGQNSLFIWECCYQRRLSSAAAYVWLSSDSATEKHRSECHWCNLHLGDERSQSSLVSVAWRLNSDSTFSICCGFVMARSHRRREQEKTVLSCPRRRCEKQAITNRSNWSLSFTR